MLAKQQQPTLQLAGHDMSPIEAGGEMLSRRERRRRDSQISAAAASQLNTLQPKHAPLSVHPCTYPNSTVGVCRTARMLHVIDGGIAKGMCVLMPFACLSASPRQPCRSQATQMVLVLILLHQQCTIDQSLCTAATCQDARHCSLWACEPQQPARCALAEETKQDTNHSISQNCKSKARKK